ncbi:phytanoyl-CoA dioxygenase family protein [Sphaerisporangium album]|nr:phytanoyl-CoA dioxygenase family protein [Sphaerisporangium album]
MRISEQHIDHLNEKGYVLVDDFLTLSELAECQAATARYFPSGLEILATPQRYAHLEKVASFPFACQVLNEVSTHPRLIDFLERVHGTTELRLGESALQAKYGPAVDAGAHDQFLHVDTWGKKSLLYPRDDGPFRQTFMIIYYSDVTADLGPTCVVSKEHTRDLALLTADRHTFRRPEDYPQLYQHEQPILARAGSVLIFSAATLHRGTAVTTPAGVRYAHFITYHAAAATWLQSLAWPSGDRPHPDSAALQRFLETGTARQREMLGFPAPGHPYWNAATLQGVSERYPGMDMTPYAEHLERRAG